jgi:hypothetical protein
MALLCLTLTPTDAAIIVQALEEHADNLRENIRNDDCAEDMPELQDTYRLIEEVSAL